MDHLAKFAAAKAASILADRVNQTRDGLIRRLDALRRSDPHLRGRALAERLGISEARLLLLDHARAARPLRPDWPALLERLRQLGTVMAFTRNHCALHEKIGRYGEVIIEEGKALVIGEEINLRLFIDQWRFGFAVRDGFLRSLQFFDRFGDAVHKIYLLDDSDHKAFVRLADDFGFAAAEPAPLFEPRPSSAIKASEASAIDIDSFRSDWDALRGLYDFSGLLARYRLCHAEGFGLAGPSRARRLPPSALRRALEIAARDHVPLVMQIENRGAVQTHAGTIANLSINGRWLHLIDPTFNFHLFEAGLSEIWMVHRPAPERPVLSLEAVDFTGNPAASIFGIAEPASGGGEWTKIVNSL